MPRKLWQSGADQSYGELALRHAVHACRRSACMALALLGIAMLAIAWVAPAAASAGTPWSRSWFDPATGVATRELGSDVPGERLQISLGWDQWLCSDCPTDWSQVSRVIVRSSNPLQLKQYRPWAFSRDGNEIKIEVHAPAVTGPDVIVGVSGERESITTVPMRIVAVGKGIDLNGDGDVDVSLIVGDWSPAGGFMTGNGNDLVDLRRASGVALENGRHPKVDISLGAGDDVGYGSQGKDYLTGGDGNDRLYGLRGNDVIRGQRGPDSLYGGAGSDVLVGGSGGDRLRGGADGDTLYGNSGNDRLFGGSGDDILLGLQGNDYAAGGAGPDGIIDHHGVNTALGGAGADYINFGSLDGRFRYSARRSRALCGPGVDQIADRYVRRRGCEYTSDKNGLIRL